MSRPRQGWCFAPCMEITFEVIQLVAKYMNQSVGSVSIESLARSGSQYDQVPLQRYLVTMGH